MNRQRSILSFFQKSSSGNHDSGTAHLDGDRRDPDLFVKQAKQNVSTGFNQPASLTADNSLAEVRGTDTPPEKVPRQILPTTFTANEKTNGSSLFSSIMHKFVKVDDGGKATQRYI